jgi:L,D-transpeptidase YcbB
MLRVRRRSYLRRWGHSGVVMGHRPLAAIAVALLLTGLSGPAWCQATTASATRGHSLEPGASSEPDPLAPPDVSKPAPAAPGAPMTPAEAKPADATDPIVALVRQKLAAARAPTNAGDRDDQAGLTAFYAGYGGEPLWVGKDGLTGRALQAMGEVRKADDWGLKASAFEVPSLPQTATAPEALADAEIKLGLAVLKYGRHARGGRVDPPSITRILDQKPTIYDPKTLMQAVAATSTVDAYLRDLHPKHPQFERLRQALLAARGAKPEEGPPPVATIPAGPLVKPGQEHDHVALLRQRLALPAGNDGKDRLLDAALVEAVKAYQRQHGIDPTGSLNGATRNALNGKATPPASENVQRLIVNMERWRWMPPSLGDFYVWDSVPDQMTAVYKDGKPILSEKIVVGRPTSPTPVFTADMLFVIFHPSWGVPSGIKTYELLPQLRSAGGGWFFSSGASAVLKAHGLQLSRGGHPVDPDSVDWTKVDIRTFDLTQPPGPRNLLGIVKFRFPNKHDVYMHDTPERHLFGGATRVFSHGCMRVQNPIRLAEVLLEHDKGWSADKVQEYVRRGGEVKLTTPIPVHVTYFTAVADDAGKIHYRPDVYALDGRIASALEGRTVPMTTASIDAREPPKGEGGGGARKKARKAEKAAPAPFSFFNPFASQ